MTMLVTTSTRKGIRESIIEVNDVLKHVKQSLFRIGSKHYHFMHCPYTPFSYMYEMQHLQQVFHQSLVPQSAQYLIAVFSNSCLWQNGDILSFGKNEFLRIILRFFCPHKLMREFQPSVEHVSCPGHPRGHYFIACVCGKKIGRKNKGQKCNKYLRPRTLTGQLFVNKELTRSLRCHITFMHLNNYIIGMINKLCASDSRQVGGVSGYGKILERVMCGMLVVRRTMTFGASPEHILYCIYVSFIEAYIKKSCACPYWATVIYLNGICIFNVHYLNKQLIISLA